MFSGYYSFMHGWHILPFAGGLLFWLWLRRRARPISSRRHRLIPRYSKQRLDVLRERNRRAKKTQADEDTGHQV